MPALCLPSCPIRSPAGGLFPPQEKISSKAGGVKEIISKHAIKQKTHNCVLLLRVFVGSTRVNLECQIRAGARMSLGNNASPKEKITKFTNSVQNIPLALEAQSSQISTVGLTLFRALPFANPL